MTYKEQDALLEIAIILAAVGLGTSIMMILVQI